MGYICVVVSASSFSSLHDTMVVQCYTTAVKCVIRPLWSSGKLIVIIMVSIQANGFLAHCCLYGNSI